MPMRAGPKGLITAPPLDLRRYPRRGGARAVRFIQRYVTVPKGTEARRPLRLRPWQREIITGVLDEPRPRQALVSIPAGNGKSTLAAALGLYGLLADGMEGAQVLVVASDERQARIIYNTAARMVELHQDLADRVQVFKDHLLEPRTNSVSMALPADPGALQGWDPCIALVDELHVVTDDTFEAMAARAGKREQSLLLAISTPPKAGQDDSAMRRLVDHGREGGDPSFSFKVYGAEVVIALDGSFSRDCTLVVATVADRPHVHLYRLWEAPEGAHDWRIPVVQVEDAIRAACLRWRVLEVAADPTGGNAAWRRRHPGE
jgi:hypothetical protein